MRNRAGDRIGYARVSRLHQNPELQRDALEAAGCVRVFTEKVSARSESRPELARAFDHLRPGDTLVVWKLDRLGRSLRDLVDMIGQLESRSIGFQSLQESLDTTTAGGKLIFHVFGALAEFERELIVERTAAGLQAARARGRTGGRPTVMTPAKLETAQTLLDATNMDGSRLHTVSDVAATIGVSRASLYRALRRQRDPLRS